MANPVTDDGTDFDPATDLAPGIPKDEADGFCVHCERPVHAVGLLFGDPVFVHVHDGRNVTEPERCDDGRETAQVTDEVEASVRASILASH